MYIWNHEAYQDDTIVLGWYKCIRDNVSDKAIEIEAEVEIEIGVWGMQQAEGLLHLIRELELDK